MGDTELLNRCDACYVGAKREKCLDIFVQAAAYENERARDLGNLAQEDPELALDSATKMISEERAITGFMLDNIGCKLTKHQIDENIIELKG